MWCEGHDCRPHGQQGGGKEEGKKLQIHTDFCTSFCIIIKIFYVTQAKLCVLLKQVVQKMFLFLHNNIDQNRFTICDSQIHYLHQAILRKQSLITAYLTGYKFYDVLKIRKLQELIHSVYSDKHSLKTLHSVALDPMLLRAKYSNHIEN